jgi:hypothetical protein
MHSSHGWLPATHFPEKRNSIMATSSPDYYIMKLFSSLNPSSHANAPSNQLKGERCVSSLGRVQSTTDGKLGLSSRFQRFQQRIMHGNGRRTAAPGPVGTGSGQGRVNHIEVQESAPGKQCFHDYFKMRRPFGDVGSRSESPRSSASASQERTMIRIEIEEMKDDRKNSCSDFRYGSVDESDGDGSGWEAGSEFSGYTSYDSMQTLIIHGGPPRYCFRVMNNEELSRDSNATVVRKVTPSYGQISGAPLLITPDDTHLSDNLSESRSFSATSFSR